MIKTLFAENILAPKTLLFDGDFSSLTFPCICKPRVGRGSRDITYLHSRNEAFKFRDYLSLSTNPGLFIIQECAKGIEYTVQMIADAEACLQTVLPVEVAVKRGITIDARVNKNEAVVNACQAIHEKIPTPGIYNIQLILTSDERVFPFEINPRVSTTLCLALAAGIDPLGVFDANLIAPKTILDYTDNVRIQRFWHNHISV